jgi:hypothetical protein
MKNIFRCAKDKVGGGSANGETTSSDRKFRRRSFSNGSRYRFARTSFNALGLTSFRLGISGAQLATRRNWLFEKEGNVKTCHVVYSLVLLWSPWRWCYTARSCTRLHGRLATSGICVSLISKYYGRCIMLSS